MADVESLKIEERSIEVPARDGFLLSATHYVLASRETCAGVILFNSATAVPQTYYRPCAQFFALQGFDVYTYDYRGIGQSAPSSLRGFDTSCLVWAKQDISAMIDFVADGHPDQKLTYFGHSVGGQLLGLAESADRIESAVFVSCQSGYWKLQGGRQKHFAAVFMHLVLPILARVMGYLPWSKLASGEDLPKGVALQWAKWCRHKNYLFDDPSLGDLTGYEKLKRPLLAYCISDDDWATYDSVRFLTKKYANSDTEYRDISPGDFDLNTLGHFGFFKRGRESLWEDSLGWIQSV